MTGTFQSTAPLLACGAYLLGSVSSAVLVCRLLGLQDPRRQGSLNPGATNVLRIGGYRAAILTLAGDMAKGFVPVALALAWNLPPHWVGLIGLAALCGHLMPLFFGFRGGKGVATMLGVCLALNPLMGLLQITGWLLLALRFRISSLAALTMALITPVLGYWLAPDYLPYLGVACLALLWRHRRNILDLRRGRENRL
ncbi:glycerol-3-phosphate 1-O-acyltransferase PlsY [Motiliproteus sp. SC1-56]|uniref:glycerol-3-phosphate 1-O-acyltransferase PlsY n=1 Tax=Motiliproteus sp. SC1-56 TaxID=2799565 RepID=UPI001A903E84|nr:glycerol-3-phosphate 1-O-acyltransferase PlsY [Motiliproteus sp. SC1-56]